MSDNEFLTAEQLGARLHLATRTVREWARKGRIPTVRLSPKVLRFNWRDVLAALQERGTGKGVTPCR